jgi:hypothetical protein
MSSRLAPRMAVSRAVAKLEARFEIWERSALVIGPATYLEGPD